MELPNLFLEPRRTYPVRRVVDLSTGRIVEEKTLPYRNLADFPQIDPRRLGRPYRRFWMAGMSHGNAPGRKFFDQLVGGDWHTGTTELFQTPPGTYLAGEPAFAPDPTAAEPEQGAVLCPIFQPNLGGDRKSAYWIFDSRDVTAGPVARIPLREPVDFAFHAGFASAHKD
jgi:all-trans-8'-apo-beta-carotenal 15,15'-oxygenase